MTNEQGGGYFAAGYDVPLLDGTEPEVRPASPVFTDAEAALRDGEDAQAYVERLSVTAAKKDDPQEPERRSLTVVADEMWIDGHARRALAAKGIERPNVAEYRQATVEAAALLSRARRQS